MMLNIKDLHAKVEEKDILKGLSIEVKPGEVHAIMGPNGSGKSTMGNVLSGRPGYEATAGSVTFKGHDLLEMETEERAREGLFLAFQYPVEIPGVSNMEFLKAAVDAKRKHQGLDEISSVDFLKLARETCKRVNLDASFLKRGVNEGFSGGEKKRNEIMQMMLLEPDLCILDETDSGLDIDALTMVANGVAEVRRERPELGVVAITHYQRLLEHLRPDVVHVLLDGRIVARGGAEVAERLERDGYDAFR